ncbi:MAG: hypothetical protein QM775_26835 [Pirellulales bacterium]
MFAIERGRRGAVDAAQAGRAMDDLGGRTAEQCVSGGFDDDDDFEEATPEVAEGGEAPVMLPPGGEVEEDVWDEADFDEEFDEDFDDEPDEDLERFEKELNDENLQQPAVDPEFDEDEDF